MLRRRSRCGRTGASAMNRMMIVFVGLLIDVYFRISCREAFAYKHSKTALKNMHSERTALAKVLGLYSSGSTHAPCHMKRYKVMRVLNLLLCLLCVFLASVSASRRYGYIIFAVYILCVLIQMLLDLVFLHGSSKRPDFSRSKRP